jgi:hypothetical protein
MDDHKLLPDLRLPTASPQVLMRVVDGIRLVTQFVGPEWSYIHRISSRHMKFPKNAMTPLSPASSYCLYTTAVKAILNWPAGFYEFLDSYVTRLGRKLQGKLAADFRNLLAVWLRTPECLRKVV